jgi:hypothetical protein
MTADDQVFAFGSLDDVDYVCHADYTGILVKHRIIRDLKVLSLSQSIIHRVSLQHEWHLNAHIKTYYVVILSINKNITSYSVQRVWNIF